MRYLGIKGYGAYVPRLRLDRKEITRLNAWAAPSLSGKGTRAICNWDEDSLTQAVEASRQALRGVDREQLGTLQLASTCYPFADRQNASVVAAALRLPRAVATLDVGGSQRAGTSSLIAGFRSSAGAGDILIAAADRRRAKPASAQELQFGDGAAAVILGQDDVLATCIDVQCLSSNFVDHFRTSQGPYDYGWEERWIRDEGFATLVPDALQGLLKRSNVDPKSIAHVILPTPFPKLAQTLVSKVGIAEQVVCDDHFSSIGNTGVAHPLLLLSALLDGCKADQKILLVGFGQGCDAVLLETTAALEKRGPTGSFAGMLARGRTDGNYLRFLSFNEEIDLDWGKRAEVDNKTALTAQYRSAEHLLGFIGGRCRQTGNVEFPKSRVSVNPNSRQMDTQDDFPLADQPASVMSYTADWLSFKESPPFQYGQVQFECGARLIMEFTDTDIGQLEVDMPLRMAFRIKDFDRRRGYRRYFWKAVPAVNFPSGG